MRGLCTLRSCATPVTPISRSSTTSNCGPSGPGEVKVRITHSGVCHSDLSAMNGTIPQPPPAVLGHEGAGIVDEVGEGVTTVVPGDHVIIAWSPPCGKCKYCVDFKQPNLCFNIMMVMGGTQFRQGDDTIGSMAGAGTFAEYTLVPEPAVGQDRQRHPARGRGADRLWRHDRRGCGDQHGQGHARDRRSSCSAPVASASPPSKARASPAPPRSWRST